MAMMFNVVKVFNDRFRYKKMLAIDVSNVNTFIFYITAIKKMSYVAKLCKATSYAGAMFLFLPL